MSVKIITDSGSDIPQDYAKKVGIRVIPLVFRFDDKADIGPFLQQKFEGFPKILRYKHIMLFIKMSAGVNQCGQRGIAIGHIERIRVGTGVQKHRDLLIILIQTGLDQQAVEMLLRPFRRQMFFHDDRPP